MGSLTRCKEQPPVDGDQVVLGQLLGRALRHGCRVVEPGEHRQGGAHDVQPGERQGELLIVLRRRFLAWLASESFKVIPG